MFVFVWQKVKINKHYVLSCEIHIVSIQISYNTPHFPIMWNIGSINQHGQARFWIFFLNCSKSMRIFVNVRLWIVLLCARPVNLIKSFDGETLKVKITFQNLYINNVVAIYRYLIFEYLEKYICFCCFVVMNSFVVFETYWFYQIL